MPEDTAVARCVEEVKKKGTGNAYAICQASTGQSYASGEKLSAVKSPTDKFNSLIGRLSGRKVPVRMDYGHKFARREPRRPRLNVKWRYDHEPVPAWHAPSAPEYSLALRRRGTAFRFALGFGEDGPNEKVRSDAEDYVRRFGPVFGVEPLQPSRRLTLNENLSKRTADAFDQMLHDPQNPVVKEAYDQFKRETLAQFEHLINRGWLHVSPWFKQSQPYRSSQDMRSDVKNLHHLWWFPTISQTQEHSFGATGGDLDPEFNPLIERTGHTIDGYKLTYNDLFRITHDIYGHAKEGFEFGPQGEFNAWAQHAKMYSPLAAKAMSVESAGQNSWVNFNKSLRRLDDSMPKKGDSDYVHPKDRLYAEQKVGMLPNDIIEDHMKALNYGPSERFARIFDSLLCRE